MRTILKYTFFTVFAGLLLLPISVSAQDEAGPKKQQKVPPTTKSENSNTDKNKEIEFPDVDGWEKGEARKYPTAALGYSIPYQSETGGTVTIYVYNGGLKNIPDGITDSTVKGEMERAKAEIIQVGRTGVYQDVEEVKNDTVVLGGTNGKAKALRSLFTFTLKGREMDSEIYLFGYKNNFIKIRATRPKSKDNTANKALADLLSKIDGLFAK